MMEVLDAEVAAAASPAASAGQHEGVSFVYCLCSCMIIFMCEIICKFYGVCACEIRVFVCVRIACQVLNTHAHADAGGCLAFACTCANYVYLRV